MSDNGFRFGDWQIDPDSNTLRNGEATSTVEPKAMDVLRYLCRHAGAVIPPEELLQACWGNAELGDNPIHKAITQLRRALGDSASEPRYIETVRKRGYRAIAPVMAGEAALEGSWQQGSPFRGLESFQESHAAIFFGRMQATAQLRELVLKQASDGCAMALVLGPSGSGKTSLVRAGLLPGLMASRTGSGEPVALACTLYMDCADLADGNLFQALAAVLMDAEVGGKLLFAGESAEGLGRWLESSDAETVAGRLAEASGRIKIGFFVDRLEAIFRAPGVTDELRVRFIAVLEHLARSKAVLVMLACRNDFYPEVIALPALLALKSRGGHFDLNPPDGAEIAQMVRMPAKAAGLKFEVDPATGASLDDVLCDEARRSPDTLPLLQYCLDELYRQRSDDGTLRFDVFNQLGGIEGAIAVRAEQVVSNLSSAQAGALPNVLALIVDVAEEQSAVTSRRVPWTALSNVGAKELLQALVDARLFVSELNGNVPSFGMAHEALLRRWPRVAGWIEEHRHVLQLRTRISQDAEKWIKAGKPRDLLLPPGIRINQANELLKLEGFSLSKLEQDYITCSHHRVRRAERIRWSVTAAIAVLALLATLLGITAYRAQQSADLRRGEAESVMSYMLGEFVDKLRVLGKLELLDNVSTRALGYLSEERSSVSTAAVLVQRAKSLQVIAEVSIARSNPQRAIDALNLARTILHKEKDFPDNADILKAKGSNSFWLGQVYFNQNEFEKAEKYFNEYLKFSVQLSETAPSSDALLEQAYAHNAIGSVAARQNRLTSAREEFEAAIALEQQIRKVKPSDRKLSADLANSIAWLLEVESKRGELHRARDLSIQEQDLLRPLTEEDPENADWAYRLALAYRRHADLEIAMGEPNKALQQLENARDIMQRLINIDPTNQSWKISIINVKIRLLDVLSLKTRPSEIIDSYHQILNELEELQTKDPKRTRIVQLIFLTKQGLAGSHLKEGSINKALKFHEESLSLIGQDNKKNDPAHASMLGSSFLMRSEIERQLNHPAAVQQACKNAQEVLKPIGQNTFNYAILMQYAKSLICTGQYTESDNAIEKLEKMKFKDVRYIEYLTLHSPKKGMQ